MKALNVLRAAIRDRAHLLERGHGLAHVSYLGLVCYESHGWYGKAAGLVLVFVLVLGFAGIDVED